MNEAKPPSLTPGIEMWTAKYEAQAKMLFGMNREPTLAQRLTAKRLEELHRRRPWWRKAAERFGTWLIYVGLRMGGVS